jgi:hypothetical protein
MKIVVFTSDKRNWVLKGFFHQWQKYGAGDFPHYNPYDIEVAGFTRPADLPKDVAFYSIGKFENYPVERWSDAIINYLLHLEDELFILMLEDYWLTRKIYDEAIVDAWAWMEQHPEAIRFDLTTDRCMAKSARYAGTFGRLDLCAAKGDYSVSFQAGIFRKSLLLENLRPKETPWEAELAGSFRLNNQPALVMGSYQWPIGYMIAVNKGQLDMAGGWMYPARTLSQRDWSDLREIGALREPVEAER